MVKGEGKGVMIESFDGLVKGCCGGKLSDVVGFDVGSAEGDGFVRDYKDGCGIMVCEGSAVGKDAGCFGGRLVYIAVFGELYDGAFLREGSNVSSSAIEGYCFEWDVGVGDELGIKVGEFGLKF